MVRLRIKVDTTFLQIFENRLFEKKKKKPMPKKTKKKIVVIKIIFWKSLQNEPNSI